eukprot:COSAG02_NODE_3743_length_6299_cov_27.086452_1_plen_532_part_00
MLAWPDGSWLRVRTRDGLEGWVERQQKLPSATQAMSTADPELGREISSTPSERPVEQGDDARMEMALELSMQESADSTPENSDMQAAILESMQVERERWAAVVRRQEEAEAEALRVAAEVEEEVAARRQEADVQMSIMQTLDMSERDWSAMGHLGQEAATRLGWTAATWDAGDTSPFVQCWSDFSDAQIAGAYTMGYEESDFGRLRSDPKPDSQDDVLDMPAGPDIGSDDREPEPEPEPGLEPEPEPEPEPELERWVPARVQDAVAAAKARETLEPKPGHAVVVAERLRSCATTEAEQAEAEEYAAIAASLAEAEEAKGFPAPAEGLGLPPDTHPPHPVGRVIVVGLQKTIARGRAPAVSLNGQRGRRISGDLDGQTPDRGLCWVVLDSGEQVQLKSESMEDDPHYTGPHRWPEPVGVDRTFATSNFRKAYAQVMPITDKHGVYRAVHKFLHTFARKRGLTTEAQHTCTETFYFKLRDEASRRELQPVGTATPETGGAAEAAVHLLAKVGAGVQSAKPGSFCTLRINTQHA